jgi:hypothetical protein
VNYIIHTSQNNANIRLIAFGMNKRRTFDWASLVIPELHFFRNSKQVNMSFYRLLRGKDNILKVKKIPSTKDLFKKTTYTRLWT